MCCIGTDSCHLWRYNSKEVFNGRIRFPIFITSGDIDHIFLNIEILSWKEFFFHYPI